VRVINQNKMVSQKCTRHATADSEKEKREREREKQRRERHLNN
jgi:hypothetical protein